MASDDSHMDTEEFQDYMEDFGCEEMMQHATIHEPLMTRKDVAEYMQISLRSVATLEEKGLLKPIRMMGIIRYRRDLLEISLTEYIK